MGQAAAHQCHSVAVCTDDNVDCQRPLGVNAPEIAGQSLVDWRLLKACRGGDNQAVKDAIKEGAFLETRRPIRMVWGTMDRDEIEKPKPSKNRGKGFTPVMCAAQDGYLEIVRTLLEAKASVNAEDEDGIRPLHLAAQSGSLEVCEALLKAGACISALDDAQRDALEYVPTNVMKDKFAAKRWKLLLDPEGGPRPTGCANFKNVKDKNECYA